MQSRYQQGHLHPMKEREWLLRGIRAAGSGFTCGEADREVQNDDGDDFPKN